MLFVLPEVFTLVLDVMQVYVPRFFVSSRQRFGATDIKALGVTALGSWTNRVIALRQISVTALFYLEDSRRIHPRSVRATQRLEEKSVEESSGRESVSEGERKSAHTWERKRARKCFGSSFCMFFPPPGPALCKLGLARSAVCST